MICEYCKKEIGDGKSFCFIDGILRKEFCSESCMKKYKLKEEKNATEV